jgi:uncharacterized membrane protein
LHPILPRLILFLSFAGMYVSGVLSLGHMYGGLVPCGAAAGCEQVALHPTSKIYGIPIALFGLAAYLMIAVLALARGAVGPRPVLVAFGRILSGSGALISLALTYVSVTVVEATCLWCLASAVIMIALFALHEVVARRPGEAARRPAVDFALAAAFGLALAVGLSHHHGEIRAAAGRLTFDPIALSRMPAEEFVPPGAPIKGNSDAPITVVKFTDFLCPACREMHREMRTLPDRYPGIRVVVRHAPLVGMKGHEWSPAIAATAEMAAERDRFWPFLDGAFLGAQRPEGDELLRIAAEQGLDPEVVKRRVSDPSDPAVGRVLRDMELRDRLSLQTTPTFILLLPGHPPRAASALELPKILNAPPYRNRLGG